jgi:hypothetical protein
MLQHVSPNRCRRLVLIFVFVVAGHSQILQDQPELCGKPGETVPLPEGTTFTYSDGLPADLTIKLRDGSMKTINLEVASSVPQVCPIAGDRLLVFGTVVDEDGPHVWILSQIDGKVLDHIGSRDPVVSPNQHWLVYRKFYPPRVEIVTESYLLYDLTKDAAGNRLRNEEPGYPVRPGRQVYPVTAHHIPFHIMDSLEPLHEFVSESLFWSSDSRFVAFADSTGGTESVVLVKVDERDLTTYVHSLKANEICEGETQSGSTMPAAMLNNVEFIHAAASGTDIWAYFSNIPCRQPARQPLRVRTEDFKPAAIELHERIRPPKK